MKKFYIFLFCFFFASAFVLSQDYKGKGRVAGFIDGEDGKPLEGVTVKLIYVDSRSGYDVVTDKNGKWSGTWLRSGNWNIDFEKPGYLPCKLSIKIKESDKNPDIEVTMQRMEGQAVSSELKSLIGEGNRLYEEGKWEESLSMFKSILDKFPDFHIINKSIGNVYFKTEQYDQAAAYYQKALEKNPGDFEAMVLIGNCYGNKGEDEKAMEWYNKIAIGEIHDVTTLYNIGTDFYEKSKFDEALKYFRRAVEVKGNFLDALYQLGLTNSTLGNYKAAVEAFEQYLKQDPDTDRAGQVKSFLEFLKTKLQAERESRSLIVQKLRE